MALIPKANINTVGQGVSRATIDKQSGVMRTAEDFGAQFGNDLENFGATGARVSATHLDNLNRAAVMDANNQFSTQARDITFKAKQLQGKNAKGALEQASKDIAAAYEKTSKELNSPVQQRAFNDAAMRTKMQNLQQVEYHEVKEDMVYKAEVDKATIFNVGKNVEALIGGPQGTFDKGVKDGLYEITKTIVIAGDRNGKSDEMVDAEVRIARENFHQQMLKGIGATDNDKALKYLEDHKEDFSPGAYKKLHDSYRKQATEVESSRFAVELLEKSSDEQQAAIEQLAKTDPEKAKSTMYWLDKLSADRDKRAKKERAENLDASMTKIDEAMAENKSPSDIIKIISGIESQTDRDSATDYYRKMSEKGPLAAVPYIRELEGMTEAQLTTADLDYYATKIPAGEMAEWRKAKADLNGENGEEKRSTALWDAKQRTMFMDNFGHLKKDPDDVGQRQKFNTSFANYMRIIKETGANDVASTTKILQDMMLEVSYDKDPDATYFTGTVTKKAAYLTADERIEVGHQSFLKKEKEEVKILEDNKPTDLSPTAVPAVNLHIGDDEYLESGYVDPHPRPNTDGLTVSDVYNSDGLFLGRLEEITWWEAKGYSSRAAALSGEGQYYIPSTDDHVRFRKNK